MFSPRYWAEITNDITVVNGLLYHILVRIIVMMALDLRGGSNVGPSSVCELSTSSSGGRTRDFVSLWVVNLIEVRD